jgi:pimeloyl-ACP methyl ester carboxylesterase
MRFQLDKAAIFLFIILFSNCLKEKKETRGWVIASDGEKIAFERKGTGDTTLLFMHGWCIDQTYWSHQVDYFSPAYTVVTMDWPGFGMSSKTRAAYDFKTYADDIHQVIQSLELQNVILIGHSMSGMAILLHGTKYPNEIIGLVGIDNLHQPNLKDSAAIAQEGQFYDYMEANYDTAVLNTTPSFLFTTNTPDSVRDRVLKAILNTDAKRSVDVLRAMSAISLQDTSMMKSLSFPLKLVNSDVFPVNKELLNQYLSRGVQVEYVHGTGHYPMVEKPDEFNQALARILKS